MDNSHFDPNARVVTTQWYCAFGCRPMVEVFITAKGVAESVRLAAKLDTVDGIEETVLQSSLDADGIVPDASLPTSTEYNLVGSLVVPASAKARPFCIGVICTLTALWTQELTLEQLTRAKHPHAKFYHHAMHVLGCDHPFAHVVSGSANLPDPRYNWS